MGRNLIVCCDGTGNEIRENQSNVLKFFRMIKKDSAQICFYDPGVGTIGDSNAWLHFRNKLIGVIGLITGYGLDKSVLQAYHFLIHNYQKGDKIYLFGFSRGAYAIRVLAGFIHMIGLLEASNENLCGYALTTYKQASEKDDLSIAWRFQEVMATRRVIIQFMGCWDTVSSVIVPRPDRGFIPSFEKLPYTKRNPSVMVFRHAIAIDERRRMFRLLWWDEKQIFKSNPFVKDGRSIDQDTEQVWFSGVHADIGGGYAESESGAAKIPLRWMVDQAEEHGVVFRQRLVSRLVDGKNPKNSTRNYTSPNVNASLHQSLNLAWLILEWLPKPARLKEWPQKQSFLGLYLPCSEPRLIESDAIIHPSVYERTHYNKTELYEPINIAFRDA